MRKPLIAGNWKMHGSKSFVKDYLSEIKQNISEIPGVELVIFPPFVYLEQVSQLLAGTVIKWGAQNVYQAAKGAFTGEIAPYMLKEFACDYVIVGHSERRQMGETNENVAEKFYFAADSGIRPVLCVGETLEQRKANQTHAVIADQLSPILFDEERSQYLSEAVIAYEPVWAIGTGLTAVPHQAQDVHEFIREQVRNVNKFLAEKLCILYGGSVKPNNAAELFAMPDIDGGLIGGASLNANEFLEIAKLCRYS
jgi:triosephosphate isomerase (TIM)